MKKKKVGFSIRFFVVKKALKQFFVVHNNYLNLWGQGDNSKCLLCSQTLGAKCGYLRF